MGYVRSYKDLTVYRRSREVAAVIFELSKLTDADGEQLETQHWLEVAQDCSYVTAEQASEMSAKLREIGKMLNSMMAKAESFCRQGGHQIGEDSTEYFFTD